MVVPTDEGSAAETPSAQVLMINNDVHWSKDESDEIIRDVVDSVHSTIEQRNQALTRLGLEIRREQTELLKMVGVLTEAEDDLVLSAEEIVRVKVAMDSGACDNVINPDDLPAGVIPSGNPSGKVFHGANSSPIRRYGHADTSMVQKGYAKIGSRWQCADVTRPLNSVSTVCGAYDGPGVQDVLFNNKTCYVVPPGVVERIMREVQAVAEYPREGNLYVAEMELSSFTRQGAGR